MSNYFGNIIGNSSLKSKLREDIESGSLSHAYIIEGPRGSGRHTIARSIAAAISCMNKGNSGEDIPCGKCKNCNKILSGSSPDVITMGIEKDKKSIGVDTIRQIKNDMYMLPNDLDIKAYIIEDADSMTEQAQNAFLLSLEEPPRYILFFLICENSSSLLETVRSRAPSLRTQRLSRNDIESFIIKNDPRAEQLRRENLNEFRFLIHASNGLIGYALSLLDNKKRQTVMENMEVASSIVEMLSRHDIPRAIEIIETLDGERADACNQLVYLQYAIRDLILLKKCDNVRLCFYEDKEAAAELSTRFTSKALIDLYDASQTAIDELESNANVTLALINMMQNSNLI